MPHRPLFLGVALLILTGTASAQDFSQYQFSSTKLADGLYMLAGAGGNVAAFVGEDAVLLVDTDYSEMTAKLRAALAAITDKPIRLVIDTHWHFDHVGGNEALAAAGVTIVAHENIRRRMAAGQTIAILDHAVPPAAAAALPTLCYFDSLTFNLSGEEIQVNHLPSAHTDGDGIVRFRHANVIHAGDVFFNCGYPFIDVSSGGSIDGTIAAVEAILRLCDEGTRIIPGHGPLASPEDLRTYLGMLRDFRAVIAGEVAAGKSLDEILAAKPTAALDEKWGKVIFPPEVFTEIVFRSLKGGE